MSNEFKMLMDMDHFPKNNLNIRIKTEHVTAGANATQYVYEWAEEYL